MRLEYAIVFMVIILSWVTSGTHFIDDMSLVNRIRSNRLQDISNNFNYDHTPAYGTVPTVPTPSAPPSASYLLVPVDRGDTQRAIAYKAIVEYLEQTNNVASLQVEHEKAYMWLAGQIQPFNSNQPGLTVQVDKSTIEHALSYEAGSQS